MSESTAERVLQCAWFLQMPRHTPEIQRTIFITRHLHAERWLNPAPNYLSVLGILRKTGRKMAKANLLISICKLVYAPCFSPGTGSSRRCGILQWSGDVWTLWKLESGTSQPPRCHLPSMCARSWLREFIDR